MRLPLLPPDRLNEDQRAFYDRALKQIEHGGFTAFKIARSYGWKWVMAG